MSCIYCNTVPIISSKIDIVTDKHYTKTSPIFLCKICSFTSIEDCKSCKPIISIECIKCKQLSIKICYICNSKRSMFCQKCTKHIILFCPNCKKNKGLNLNTCLLCK